MGALVHLIQLNEDEALVNVFIGARASI